MNLTLLEWQKTTDSLVRLADGTLHPMQDARRLDTGFDLTRSWELDFIAPLPGDEPFSAYVRRIGFSDPQLAYVRRSWANAACESPDRISAAASIEELTDHSAGTGDFWITDGYDMLIDHVAAGLNIRLDTVVSRVDWSGRNVRVEASNRQGNVTFDADRIVIALPLGVLQSGMIAFTPTLPAEKQDVIDRLIMGVAVKLLYAFDTPILPADTAAIYSPRNPPMWWSPTYQRDTSRQVITAFATGDWARELLAMGEAEALAHGLRTLEAELGRNDLQPAVMRLVDWSAEPFTRGGYSVAPVGGVHLRHTLAQPIDGKLFWAGEATASNAWAGTVHGAYASGRRAAVDVLSNIFESGGDISAANII